MKIAIAVLFPLLALVAPEGSSPTRKEAAGARGPYHFQVPVPGLRARDAGLITKALEDEFGKRALLEVAVHDDRLEFLAGGDGPRGLLRLSRIERCLARHDVSLDRRPWFFPEQTVGLVLKSRGAVGGPAIEKAVATIEGARVIGTLLDGGSMVLVVECAKGARWTALTRSLATVGVSIDDVLWGHWKYGWGLATECNRHASGAVIPSKKAKNAAPDHDHDHDVKSKR